jgi:hypothetical protein
VTRGRLRYVRGDGGLLGDWLRRVLEATRVFGRILGSFDNELKPVVEGKTFEETPLD